jgi:hypothetical protein
MYASEKPQILTIRRVLVVFPRSRLRLLPRSVGMAVSTDDLTFIKLGEKPLQGDAACAGHPIQVTAHGKIDFFLATNVIELHLRIVEQSSAVCAGPILSSA